MSRRITYINTPASFGVEITEPNDTMPPTTFQLANPRDTMTLIFAVKTAGEWGPTMPVTNPERFMDRPPKTQHEWEQVIAAWCRAADEQKESTDE